jgi:probable HAF family extracellular repeat protein
MKRLIFGLVVLSLVAVGNVWGQVQYTVTNLGTGDAFSINDLGQVVGAGVTSDGHAQGFLYNDGSVTTFGSNSAANGINNSGQIVGFAGNQAFLYSSGTMQYYQYPPDATANAINNNGQVIVNNGGSAFLFSGGPNSAWTEIGTLGGNYNIAYGINDYGQVVGQATTPGDYTFYAYLCSGGTTMTNLGTLSGGTASTAYAINNSGQVVGQADISSGPNSLALAFLWSSGSGMQNLGTFGGNYSIAYAINNLGQVVGGANTSSDGYDDAFLYSGGVMQDLNNLISPNSGWVLEDATGINDSGQICGDGEYQGKQDAFLLTPISTPEPSALALLAAGALGLLGYGLRRRRVARRTAKPAAFDQQDDAPAILSMPSRWSEAARRAA